MNRQERRQTVLSTTGVVCLVLALVVCTGCARRHDVRAAGRPRPIPEAQVNRQIVRGHFDEQAHAGALASRTLYPHHFHQNLSALNLLGERQLNLLAANSDTQPLRLHVAPGDVDEALYEARLAVVRDRLSWAGIEQVEFLEAPPPAGSISSDRAIRAIQRERQPATATGAGDTGAGAQTGR